MQDRKADLCEQFLLESYEILKLEFEYNFDMGKIFIQLRDTENDKCTVFDCDALFEQVYEFLHKEGKYHLQKRYEILMNDKKFIGTAEDVVRWYCNQKGIKLYIVELDDGSALVGGSPGAKERHLIVELEGEDTDIETGYRVFFRECLLDDSGEDYTIREM